MNEQTRHQSASVSAEFSAISPATSDQQKLRRQRCAQCGKPFGLVRRRRAGLQFCSAACMNAQADGVGTATKASARWYTFLTRRG